MLRFDTDTQLRDALFGIEIQPGEERFLGNVIGTEWQIGKPMYNPYEDLSFEYTISGVPGAHIGTLIVIPEPGTLVMLFSTAAIGLLLVIRRRRSA